MTLKIETSSEGEVAVVRLTGRIEEDHLDAIRAQVRRFRPQLVFDLAEATLVERVVVQFLAASEFEGVELRHCPRYVREWIHRELGGPKERDE